LDNDAKYPKVPLSKLYDNLVEDWRWFFCPWLADVLVIGCWQRFWNIQVLDDLVVVCNIVGFC